MEIAFVMGMVAGFLIGLFFCLVIKQWIRLAIYEAADQLAKEKKNKAVDYEDDDDDGANFWKPQGWEPDRP